MGRLKGVIVGLGMQVSFFLAYLWQHTSMTEGGGVPELSQADLSSAAHKFRRYRQDMSEQEKGLFTQEKVDGKGQPHFFIKCWEGLQLLLSKVADKGKQACEHAHMHKTHTQYTHARTHTHTMLACADF